MSDFAVIRIERGIMSVLQVLTGPRASGSVVVRALAGTPTMPANTYGLPVITSAAGVKGFDRSRMVKTVGDVALTTSGVAVPIVSVVGGSKMNLQAGTEFVWDGPAPAGVEARSTLAADMTGGAPSTLEAGALKRVLPFEGIGKEDLAKSLWSAQGSPDDFPAAIVSWEGSRTVMIAGRGGVREVHTFRVYLVTSRLDGNAQRSDEGKICLQAVKSLLTDRSAADGESISNPPLYPGNSGRLITGTTAFVYWAEFECGYAVRKRELRSFADWTKSNIKVQTAPQDQPPTPANAPEPLPEVDEDVNQ
jgi:hypothetical protein